MHSFIISGGSEADRQEIINKLLSEWQVSPFDTVELSPEEGSIGIAGVRAFNRALLLAPAHGPVRLGLIRGGESLTIEAQQALLKTLEEPPPRAKIILETETQGALLPTILSRCETITIKQPPIDEPMAISLAGQLMEMFKDSTGLRLSRIDSLPKTRPEAQSWLTSAILTGHQLLLSEYGLSKIHLPDRPPNAAKMLRTLLIASKYLSANLNPKLALDSLVLR